MKEMTKSDKLQYILGGALVGYTFANLITKEAPFGFNRKSSLGLIIGSLVGSFFVNQRLRKEGKIK